MKFLFQDIIDQTKPTYFKISTIIILLLKFLNTVTLILHGWIRTDDLERIKLTG